MDEQSIINFLKTLEADETLPPVQKLKLIRSALNVTSSTSTQAGGDSSTASLLLKQALDKFSELSDANRDLICYSPPCICTLSPFYVFKNTETYM